MDFDKIIERKNTDSIKWCGMEKIFGTNDLLPMWVADMDFSPPLEILEALKERINHPVFGYSMLKESTFTTIQQWMKKRYHWEISESWVLPSHGVVTSIAFSIQALTKPGDGVLIQTPVYAPFYQMIEANDRVVVKNPLILNDGKYEIDFDDFEKKCQSGVKLFILCNPHNPVGRVWTKEELEKMGFLCEKYGVNIVSDEIHADIIYNPNVHTPIASINEDLQGRTISLYAPSKTFNIPGIQSSFMVISNESIRLKIQKTQQKVGFHGLNVFANTVLDVAYKHGERWLETLISYLQSNIELATNYIRKEIPELKVIQPEGTYLLWIDCRATGLSDDELKEHLIKKGKLALEPGTKYGVEGSGFVRMNIGCPKPILIEGLRRLKKAFQE
ncbi:MalY/PatB family protein [Fervidibacillus halotolerans]|uniref:cysteine-S-conjugate beta-lyase n=1 Tax=Fervidibacillus halotolerans TaxID=2980027 RepID=A0A9E8RZN8_9BACI|nr:MalY/PatB family protein [Fervidibacillus halotolerans]WAA11822.1 pyridoxal phosphate-dependent aminotransferase [Fervidibacillus halotolerans]